MIAEEWRPVVGYEGLYEVSNLGRVKRVEGIAYNSLGVKRVVKEKIMKLKTEKRGYITVGLTKNKVKKWLKVHRLVATAFIPNPYNLPQVNHKDEIKSNNVYVNIEWCDSTYNNNYGTRLERAINKIKVPVYMYDLNTGAFIRGYESATEAERQLGYNHSNIAANCQGKRKSGYGYNWSYEKKENYFD